MKTPEEIEKLADSTINKEGYTTDDFIIGFEQGYTQCQEDVADKKYTEEDMRNALNVGMSAEAGDYPKGWSFDCGISLEDYFINSLNKK